MRLLSMVVGLLGALALASTAAVADVEHGKRIYAQKCASCHGPDGKGNPKMEEMLKVKIPALAGGLTRTDSELMKIVSEGKRPMPSFGKALSREDMEAVLHHVRSLSGR